MDPSAQNGLQTLAELEEKVRRATEALRQLADQRDTARAEAEKLRTALQERADTIRHLETQLLELETERAEVRSRVERLVAQIDSLTGAKP
jgi:chromosome segregation ATPase